MLTGEIFPRNERGDFPFYKSQLDSHTFGVAVSMGLWTRYNSKIFELMDVNLKKGERD